MATDFNALRTKWGLPVGGLLQSGKTPEEIAEEEEQARLLEEQMAAAAEAEQARQIEASAKDPLAPLPEEGEEGLLRIRKRQKEQPEEVVEFEDEDGNVAPVGKSAKEAITFEDETGNVVATEQTLSTKQPLLFEELTKPPGDEQPLFDPKLDVIPEEVEQAAARGDTIATSPRGYTMTPKQVSPVTDPDQPLVKFEGEEPKSQKVATLDDHLKFLAREHERFNTPATANLLAQGEKARAIYQMLEEHNVKHSSPQMLTVERAAYHDMIMEAINGPLWNATRGEIDDYVLRVNNDFFDGKFAGKVENIDDVIEYRKKGGQLPSGLGFEGEKPKAGDVVIGKDDAAWDLTAKGAATSRGGMYRAAEAIEEITGVKFDFADVSKKAKYYEAIAQNLPEGAPLSSVNDLSSALKYVSDISQTQLGNVATSLTGGVAGGILRGSVGAYIGAFGTSFPMELGEVQKQMKELDPEQKAGVSNLLFAGAAAALDAGLGGQVGASLTKEFGKEVADQIALRMLLMPAKEMAKQTGKGAAKGLAMEAPTESLQGLLEEVGAAVRTGKPLKPGLLYRMMEQGVAGAVMGGQLGTVAGASEATAGFRARDTALRPWATTATEQSAMKYSPSQRMGEIPGRPVDLQRTKVDARPVTLSQTQREQRVRPRLVRPTPNPVSAEGKTETHKPPSGTITSTYGHRTPFRTLNGRMSSSNHLGLDIAKKLNAKVEASASGVVVRTPRNKGGYGNQVVIRHSDGTTSTYSHLNKIGVEVGQQIAQGQSVGGAGKTGNATGVHVHFELRNRNGAILDPRTKRQVTASVDPDSGMVVDDTEYEVAQAPKDYGEEDFAAQQVEEDAAFTEATGQAWDEEDFATPEEEEAEPALARGVEAPAETPAVRRGAATQAFDEDDGSGPASIQRGAEASLDEAQAANPARAALAEATAAAPEAAAAPAEGAVDYGQPQPGEEPMYGQDDAGLPTEEVVGFTNPETGTVRVVGEAPAAEASPTTPAAPPPEATLPAAAPAVGGPLELVEETTVPAAAPTPLPEQPQPPVAPAAAPVDIVGGLTRPEREAALVGLGIAKAGVAAKAQGARVVGQSVGLGLSDPVSLKGKTKAFKTAYNVGLKQGQKALATAKTPEIVTATSSVEVSPTTQPKAKGSKPAPKGKKIPALKAKMAAKAEPAPTKMSMTLGTTPGDVHVAKDLPRMTEGLKANVERMDKEPAADQENMLDAIGRGIIRDGDMIVMGSPRWAIERGYADIGPTENGRMGRLTEKGKAKLAELRKEQAKPETKQAEPAPPSAAAPAEEPAPTPTKRPTKEPVGAAPKAEPKEKQAEPKEEEDEFGFTPEEVARNKRLDEEEALEDEWSEAKDAAYELNHDAEIMEDIADSARPGVNEVKWQGKMYPPAVLKSLATVKRDEAAKTLAEVREKLPPDMQRRVDIEDRFDALDERVSNIGFADSGIRGKLKTFVTRMAKDKVFDEGDVSEFTEMFNNREDYSTDEIESEIKKRLDEIKQDMLAEAKAEVAPAGEVGLKPRTGKKRPSEEKPSGSTEGVPRGEETRPRGPRGRQAKDPAALVRSRLDRADGKEVQNYTRGSGETARPVGRVEATFTPTEAYSGPVEAAGYVTQPMVELRSTTAGVREFSDAMATAKAASPFGAAVYTYSPSEYLGMRLFVSEDGQSGFALKPDGDIVSVFSPGGGRANAMLDLAVQEGGTKLDAFDTELVTIYGLSGFKEYKRDEWDEQYAPEGWDKDTFSRWNNGEPAIVYMEYDATYNPFAEEKPAAKARVVAPKPKARIAGKKKAPATVEEYIAPPERDSKAIQTYGEFVQNDLEAVWTAMEEVGIHGEHKITIELVGEELAKAHGLDYAGLFDNEDRSDLAIRIVAWSHLDTLQTGRHEIVHWMKDVGIISKEDWISLALWANNNESLMAWAVANYPHLSREAQVEEAVAEGYARWENGDSLLRVKAKDKPTTAKEKFFDMLHDLRAWLELVFGRAFITRAQLADATRLMVDIRTGEHLRKWDAAQVETKTSRTTFERAVAKAVILEDITVDQSRVLRAIGEEGLKARAVWHGSPQTMIERFSNAYIGTGEKAQAKGWGLYFADKKGVADWYRAKLTMDLSRPATISVTVGGQPIIEWSRSRFGNAERNSEWEKATDEVATLIHDYLTKGGLKYNGWLDTLHAAHDKEAHGALADAVDNNHRARIEADQRKVAQLFHGLMMKDVAFDRGPTAGALYKVDIPDNHMLLDLDKKLGSQPELVTKALTDLRGQLVRKGLLPDYQRKYGDFWSWTGDTLQLKVMGREMIIDDGFPDAAEGSELAVAIAEDNGPMAASLYLKELGIPGNQYLDRDSRDPAQTTKTQNYVIFDDTLIDITGKEVKIEYGRSALPERGGKRRVIRSPVASKLGDPTVVDPNAMQRLQEGTMNLLNKLGEWDRSADVDASDTLIDAFTRKIVQRYHQIEKTQARAAAELGTGRLAPEMNPMERITADERGYKMEHLMDNQVKPLARVMADRGIELADLGLYLYARHAPARNRAVAKINPEFRSPDKPGSGMTDADAAQIMQDFAADGRINDLQEAAKHIDRMIEMAQQERIKSGLITQDAADKGFAPQDHYVPLRGHDLIEPELEMQGPIASSAGKGFSVRGSETHRMYGRESRADLESIVGYTISQAQHAIDRSYRNEVVRTMYNLFRAVPDSNFVQIDRVKRVATWNKKKGIVEYQMQTRIVDPKEEARTIYFKDGETIHKMTFNDKNPSAMRFVNAAKNLGVEEMPGWIRAGATFTKLWTQSNTQWNPEFILANAVKDVQIGVVNASSLSVKGLRRAIIKNLASLGPLRGATRGAFSAAGAGEGSGNEWFETFARFEKAGGKLNYNQTEQLDDIIKKAKREIELAKKHGLTSPTKAAILALEFVSNLNSSVENMTRLAAFKALIDAGIPDKQAAEAVRELTTNFQQHGEWGPKINAFYGFANASTIGSARFAKTLATSPLIMVGLMTAGLMMDMLNHMLEPEEWDKYTEEEKDGAFKLMLPEWVGFDVNIPAGYGINVFITVGRKMSEGWREKKDENGNPISTAEMMADVMYSMANAFAPISGNSLLNLAFPSIADPVANIINNRNNWGRKLYPDEYPGQVEPLSQQSFDSTNEFWKGMATGMNALTGGNDVVKGLIDVHPGSLEHLAAETVGGLGRTIARTYALPGKVMSGEWGPNDLTIIRRFASLPHGADTGPKATVASFNNRYYTAKDTITTAEKVIERYGPKSAEYRAFYKDNKPAIKMQAVVKDTGKILKPINAAKKALEKGMVNEGGLTDKQAKAITKVTGYNVSEGDKLTQAQVDKAMVKVDEARLKLAEQFSALWEEKVMGAKPKGSAPTTP